MKTSWIPLVLVTIVALAQGCATHRPVEQAQACPQCVTASDDRLPRAVSPDEAGFSYADIWLAAGPQHQCLGCQGTLVTLVE